jgi:arginase
MHRLVLSAAALGFASLLLQAAAPSAAADAVPVGVVINPYAGDRAGPEQDDDARAMAQGLAEVVEAAGGTIVSQRTVALTAQDEARYGRWNRFGLANGHLATMAGENQAAGLLNLGLYNNCSSLMGMLGGMPVAIAAGDGLTRMRIQSGLIDPLPKRRIVMVGVRDTDPLEQERIDRDRIPQITTADVRSLSDNLRQQMAALTEQSDIVYVHVDLDVLDPSEVSGHPLTVPDGPTGAELAEAIRVMFTYPKTAALGIASYPHTADPGGLTLKAVRSMVAGAVQGMQER